ncbi:hypothetical protein TB2_028604 [Malus domestica]
MARSLKCDLGPPSTTRTRRSRILIRFSRIIGFFVSNGLLGLINHRPPPPGTSRSCCRREGIEVWDAGEGKELCHWCRRRRQAMAAMVGRCADSLEKRRTDMFLVT